MEINQLIPGILVSGKVSLKGGVTYIRDYGPSEEENGRLTREWSTTAIIEDVEERKTADRVRSKIYNKLKKVCANTPIGLICPIEKRAQLEEILKEIEEERENFNREAETCILQTHYGLFEVKENNHDVINSVVDQLKDGFSNVVRALDISDKKALETCPKRFLRGSTPSQILKLEPSKRDAFIARARAELIRNSLKDLNNIESLLPEENGEVVSRSIKSIKGVARSICNRVEKNNETIQQILSGGEISLVKKNCIAILQSQLRKGDVETS